MFENSKIARILVFTASFVVIVAGMRLSAPILVPFLLAIFISVITTPILIALQRKGIPNVLALLILISAIIVIGIVSVRVIGESLSDFSKNLPIYQNQFQELLGNTLSWLKSKGIDTPEKTIYDALNPKNTMKLIGNIVGGLSGILSKTFLIILIVIFILLEASILPSKVRSLPGLSENTWRRLRRTVEDVRQYMGMKTLMSLLTGGFITILLIVFDIDYAVLLGILAFFLNYVPSVGSVIASIPGILLTLLQHGPVRALIILIGYIIINIGISNFVEPRFMGRRLGLSPLFIVISLIFWGWVLGPMGTLLSIPLTMTVKIAMESGKDTRWLALLMESSVKSESQDTKADHS